MGGKQQGQSKVEIDGPQSELPEPGIVQPAVRAPIVIV